MKYLKDLSALAALSLLTTNPYSKDKGRHISHETKQPLEVPKAFKNQPKPLSKKQKAKIKKCKQQSK